MEVEKFRGYVAAIVAALMSLGSLVGAVLVWLQPVDPSNPREVALIFGVLTGAFSSASTFLFLQESSARASHSAERAFTSGAYEGRTNGNESTPLYSTTMETFSGRPDDEAPRGGYSGESYSESIRRAGLGIEVDIPDEAEPDSDERGSDVLTAPPGRP